MNARNSVSHFCGFLLAVGLGHAASVDDDDPRVALRGLVDINGVKRAYLEPATPVLGTYSLVLGEGQRVDDVEVTGINLSQRKVSLLVRDKARELSLDPMDQNGTFVQASATGQFASNHVAVCLGKMNLEQTLDLYVALANRTVLRPAQLTAIEFSLCTTGYVSSVDLQKAIGSVLKRNGLVAQPHGESFLLVAPQGELGLVSPEVSSVSKVLAASLTQQQGSNVPDLIPPGSINFPSTPLRQVLEVYQGLLNRTVIRPGIMPEPMITFRNANPLTCAEVVFGLNATLALNGLSVMPAGDKFVFVFPTARKDMAAEVLARKPVAVASSTNSIPSGSIDLNMATLPALAKLYQELSGHILELDPDLPNARVLFRSQTPLTPSEALQGLEYVLGWNNLVIKRQEDKFILTVANRSR